MTVTVTVGFQAWPLKRNNPPPTPPSLSLLISTHPLTASPINSYISYRLKKTPLNSFLSATLQTHLVERLPIERMSTEIQNLK